MAIRHLIVAGSLIVGSATTVSGQPAGDRPVARAGATFHECRDCPVMVVVPPGSFAMGSPATEVGRFDNEGPQHDVVIAQPFAISVYDVTVAEYRRFVEATGRPVGDDCRIYDPTFVNPQLVRVRGKNWRQPNFTQSDKDPVVCVSYDDALAYVDWLNSLVDRQGAVATRAGPYRLPSEAEWEYAARAGSRTPFYWGTDLHRSDANYGPDELAFAPVAKGADRWGYTSPVGAFPPNAFGLYDMAGNVWQFTTDCWSATYNAAPRDGTPRGGTPCSERVVRGGSWFKPPAGERSAKRGEGKIADLKGSAEIGFRVARTIDGP